jgi:hypothetical protein
MLRAHRRALGVPEDDGALRRALGLADGETIPRNHCVEPFTFHDLRRSMRTRLSALAIPDEVRELMIAHRPSGCIRPTICTGTGTCPRPGVSSIMPTTGGRPRAGKCEVVNKGRIQLRLMSLLWGA